MTCLKSRYIWIPTETASRATRTKTTMAKEAPARQRLADVVARRHLADIDDRIARLTGLRAEVQAMLDQCTGGQVRECRVIEVLADHGECLSDRHRS